MYKTDKVEGIVLYSRASSQRLNERQRISYKDHREKYIKWLTRRGKDPDSLDGYAHDTAKNYASIIDKVHRWKWEQHGGYTTDLDHDDADSYLTEQIMADEEYSNSHLHNIKLALKAYFRFKNGADEWDCDITVKSSGGAKQPKDYLSIEERKAIREAVLEYGSVPAYASLSPEKRDEWKLYLARKFGKPVNDVGQQDWDRANGFKYVSMVHTALDAALRPVEVGRAKTYWVDVENGALRIPAKDSSKNEDNWTTSVRTETASYLARWLEERELYDKYDDTDSLWLTRHGNPYNSSSLKVLLDNLREIAGIEREFSWYALRHSTGTYMSREEDLAAAQSQLRHQSKETTMKYDNVSPEDRRDALDRIG